MNGHLKASLVIDVEETNKTGAISFRKEAGIMMYRCPCGCGILGYASIRGPGTPTWDGNQEKPTLLTSFLIEDDRGPHWRGRLLKGVWIGCRAIG